MTPREAAAWCRAHRNSTGGGFHGVVWSVVREGFSEEGALEEGMQDRCLRGGIRGTGHS